MIAIEQEFIFELAQFFWGTHRMVVQQLLSWRNLISCVIVGGELMNANSYVSHNGAHALGHKQKIPLSNSKSYIFK